MCVCVYAVPRAHKTGRLAVRLVVGWQEEALDVDWARYVSPSDT